MPDLQGSSHLRPCLDFNLWCCLQDLLPVQGLVPAEDHSWKRHRYYKSGLMLFLKECFCMFFPRGQPNLFPCFGFKLRLETRCWPAGRWVQWIWRWSCTVHHSTFKNRNCVAIPRRGDRSHLSHCKLWKQSQRPTNLPMKMQNQSCHQECILFCMHVPLM